MLRQQRLLDEGAEGADDDDVGRSRGDPVPGALVVDRFGLI